MMQTTDSAQLLFTRIVQALKAGGDLTEKILAFIETSFPLSDSEHLASFLNDDEDCERDTLLDLIFYPDQAAQIDLEPLLETARFTGDDEQKIMDRLLAHAIEAPIRMPDKRELTCIRLPEFVKSRYLERLNIVWQSHSDVVAAIDTGVSDSLRSIVKVRLRNTGLRLENGQALFLSRFFTRMDDGHPDYLSCLELVLSLLDEKNAAARVYDLLVDCKRTCFRSLLQARRFESLLRRSNMETLMLQGIRAPQESPDELIRRMALIDHICYGIYGRTEIMAPPMEEPMREVTDLDSPAAAVRSLSR